VELLTSLVHFQTLVTTLEVWVNSRPLTSVSDDPDDPAAITPIQFLVGHNLLPVDFGDGLFRSMKFSAAHIRNLRNAQLNFENQLWDDFMTEYLVHLRFNHKQRRRRASATLVPGALVLIDPGALHAPVVPRRRWPLARIVSIVKGHDGEDRVLNLRLPGSNDLIQRAVQSVVPLELPL
jgi:hypothetical protein